MFGITKDRLVRVLGLLQATRCAYCQKILSGNHRCDCKYVPIGGELSKHLSESGPGCCELSLAYRLLEAMTDREYARLCRRAGVYVDALPETHKPLRKKKVSVNPLTRVAPNNDW